ncbi:conjugal transfer pilus assembly protein TraV [Modicisalibacter xianhensis]|uniref:Conjugal transfer pilus assembly protein TraV n=1 Tax=Modicisalibacter xianhensis TaxID=442341 RepID=A0A4R8FKN0_9GAMM|nr:type IV conjugative transfer system lipoprotein TraV [Halomonas xianhensis]TDX26806.1 conjugal transfer pilus assembly protein TraV [Halomonas xianhensis]
MAILAFPLKTAAVLGLAVLMSGCSAFNIGESEYGCTGLPQGVQCMSTRQVYQLTNNGNVPAPLVADEQREAAVPVGSAITEQYQGEDPNDVVNNYVAPRLPDQPIPIRTPAQVMRVWIAPWEDDNGDLVVTGYLYTEIEPRRWVIGDQAPTVQPTLRPLQTIEQPQQKDRES